jgi:hypothetical protein
MFLAYLLQVQTKLNNDNRELSEISVYDYESVAQNVTR